MNMTYFIQASYMCAVRGACSIATPTLGNCIITFSSIMLVLCNLTFFQVALTVLESNQDKLLTCRDDGEAMQLLGDYLQGVFNEEGLMTLRNKDGEEMKKVLLFCIQPFMTHLALHIVPPGLPFHWLDAGPGDFYV
jgi:hypothetical protein